MYLARVAGGSRGWLILTEIVSKHEIICFFRFINWCSVSLFFKFIFSATLRSLKEAFLWPLFETFASKAFDTIKSEIKNLIERTGCKNCSC